MALVSLQHNINKLLQHDMPLALSNSVTAKIGRSIAFLALIARELLAKIFKPTYLANEDMSLRSELLFLAQNNPPKEAFTRALLISLNRVEDRDPYIEDVIQQVLRQVKLLVDQSAVEKFRSELRSISTQAAHIWSNTQSRKSHFEVSFDFPDDQRWTLKSIKLSNTNMAFEEVDVAMNNLAIDAAVGIFPQISIVSSQDEIMVFPGRVFQMSQMAAMKQEVLDLQKLPAPLRRAPTGLERRPNGSKRQRDTESKRGSFLE